MQSSNAELQQDGAAKATVEPMLEEAPVRTLHGWSRWAFQIICVLVAAWTLYGTIYLVPSYTFRMVHLGLILAGVFWLFPARSGSKSSPTVLDWICIATAVAALAYVHLDLDDFVNRAVIPTNWDLFFGGAIMLLTLEACRRTVGWPLVIVILAVLAYALFGNLLPPPWGHRGYSLVRLIGHLFITQDGIFGVPLDVSVTLITLFVIYGAILEQTGAGRFFLDFAFALTRGKTTVGVTRSVILSSFLLGGPSGSGTATTLTVGAVANPMLRKAGYSPDRAGALFAAGGIGAVLSPPVMGAASFLIAEMLNVPYLTVIQMALMPTLLYYVGIFVMIEADSRRQQLAGVRIDYTPADTAWNLMKKYWFHLSSLFVVVILMVVGFSTVYAILWSIVAAAAFSYLRAETRLTPTRLWTSFSNAGREVLSVAAICAAAGMLVGAVNLTGLGFKFSDIIIGMAGGSLFLTLVLTAVILMVIGLAMPITASYVVAAVITVPAMTKLGVPDVAAHMFVFYYALLSEVSPPVALAPMAAAALTGGNPWRTTMITWLYTLPCFVVPFMFTINTDGLALLLIGSWDNIIWTNATALLAVVSLGAGIGGWLITAVRPVERAALILAGLLMFYPAKMADFVGIAIFGVTVAVLKFRSLGAPPTEPS
jgi:TRAP transporter 4TM/12TM fusion protein